MTNADVHTLTGAYVLHALSEAERAAFESHLGVCEACTQEVAELAATAGRLGLAVSETPPPELKARVMGRIPNVRQESPLPKQPSRAGGNPVWGLRASRWALAACLAAAAGLGGVAVWQHEEARDARAEAGAEQRRSAELAAVLGAPDAKAGTARLGDGASATVVVSKSRDKAAFVSSGLATPPSGKVYQLWFADGDTMRPAGLLDPASRAQAVLLDGPVDQASGMGITVEPAGGSPKPTSAPVALMNFPV
ncbi:anti-sigma factor [Streptomyces sp. NBC_00145]|uniref:anti-sigma factor n=1 Tax=Streptomyces sp. NBC_00145 TaxID=2975666 RepID=UPI002E19C9D0